MNDIGKAAILDAILLKPGLLSFAEFEQMKPHVWIGDRVLLRDMEITEEKGFLEYAAEVAVSHQEKWAGSGYPKGLSNMQIPLSGRILAVVDIRCLDFIATL